MSAEMACLLLRGGVPEREVEAVLASAVHHGQNLVALIARERPELLAVIERELLRLNLPSLEIVRPHPELMARLPDGLCARLGAVPIRQDARSGRIDAAALDPLDPHVAGELAHHLASSVRLLAASAAALNEALGAGPGTARAASGPPLPLVQKPLLSEQPRPAAPSPGALEDEGEPVLSLSRPKAKPVTAPKPPQAVGPEPIRARQEPAKPPVVAPAKPPEPVLPSLEASLAGLEQASTSEAVLEALLAGFGPAPTVALAVRSDGYEGRAASAFIDRTAARRLKLSAGAPSIAETALKSGHYLGSLPLTPIHGELRVLLGSRADGEVYAAPISVSGRPSLLVVTALVPALGGSVDATRRADRLRAAASRALERILVRKKRGGSS